VVRVSYANPWQRGTLLVKHFLTHAEYDKDLWRKDCRWPAARAAPQDRPWGTAARLGRFVDEPPGSRI